MTAVYPVTENNPVLVNTWRGSTIECRHRGAVAVVDVTGRLVLQYGDIDRPEFPRSAIKYLQAIPLVESGAAEHFALTAQHLSFACASHNAEHIHTDLAQSWLEKIGCVAEDLECGAELPMDHESLAALVSSGGTAQRYHHNCSGKHLGLLTTCRYMDDNVRDYRLYHHPAQQRWLGVLEDLTGLAVSQHPWGYDGCGIPALALPLRSVAQAFAHFADPQALPESRADAVARISAAVAEHPYMVAGRNRLCTALMELTGQSVLVKTGAEGYYTATVPQQGYGIALKIDDGHSRASMAAIGAVLRQLGVLSNGQADELKRYIQPEVTNSRNDTVGRIEAVLP